jgi:tetratricopeptide (TPR) repeat protein
VISHLLGLAAALSLQAAPAAPARTGEAEAARCAALARSDANRAVKVANEWRLKGGGFLARQCLGLAYSTLGQWAPAATAFEQAAREAETAKDPRRSDYLAQSGNAWIAAGDLAKAMAALDAAVAAGAAAELLGEVHFDRARILVEQNDVAAARADIDKGLALAPADPFGWFISALLARRQGDLARARVDISRATQLAPDDADILLEAGNIAGLAGDVALARGFYLRVQRQAPDSAAGRAAAAALIANPEPPPAPPAPATPAPSAG